MVPDYDATAPHSRSICVVTYSVNGVIVHEAIVRVVDDTTAITISDLRPGFTYAFTVPTREVLEVPRYEIPRWLKEQRRVPKNKRHVPAFKPGPGRSYRRGAY